MLPSLVKIMGILNATPDSFADGGRYLDPQLALKHAASMVADGADIIDVGGESTRPGAAAVSLDEELNRIIPVIEAIRVSLDVAISIDTSKPEVMAAAIKSGATIINDVNALMADGALIVAAKSEAEVVLMHKLGEPKTMQNNPIYTDVIGDIKQFFKARIADCMAAGIKTERLIIDPGFGFGKTLSHNLEILTRLYDLKSFGLPILVGLSRKSMIGAILHNRDVEGRVTGSIAAALIAVQNGAKIIRTHDVLATKDALNIWQATQ